jgi:hypothetical protein
MSESLEQYWRWHGLPSPIQTRIESVLKSWYRTPYQSGQRARGIGVDCREFVVAVLDELYRRPSPTLIERLSPDSGVHGDKVARRAVAEMLRSFPSHVYRPGFTLEPGDILVTLGHYDLRAPDRLRHAMIVGTRPFVLWHASNENRTSGVCFAHVAKAGKVLRLYRPKDKQSWA